MKFRRSKHPVLPWQRSLDLDVHAKRSRLEFTQERMAEYLEISVGEYKLIESYGHVPKTSYFLLICWKLQLNPLCYLKQALDAVLLDSRLELTNNLAERTVKPFVMARRNFLFCDTAKGADASALCFSVIETAKRNGLDPFGYLMFLLQELPKLGPDPVEERLLPLLPWSPDLPGYCKIKQ